MKSLKRLTIILPRHKLIQLENGAAMVPHRLFIRLKLSDSRRAFQCRVPSKFTEGSLSMHLDTRLSLIASLVRKGSRVADIGTDHAYLPAFLVERGICPSAIASDVRRGPADRASQTVSGAGLSGRISVRLGNGLQPVLPGEADDIVIAGMGGETIASILDGAPWIKDARYRLILQPMTKPEILREYLLTHDCTLTEEHVAYNGDHSYLVICAGYDPAAAASQRNRPAVYYRGILDKEEGRAYLAKLYRRLRLVADAQRRAGRILEAEKLEAIGAAVIA